MDLLLQSTNNEYVSSVPCYCPVLPVLFFPDGFLCDYDATCDSNEPDVITYEYEADD